jgi:NAD(P)-dependent dehydrogenase (short-subunit alcohol dehydrogenase family)
MKTPTILITGSSSGIGRAAVQEFSRRGWNVAATARRPEQLADLAQLPRVQAVRLDVLHEASIQQAVQATLERFGGIDVLVNNAGYGLLGPFEACTEEQIRHQFETNFFGLLNVTRAVLPLFRKQCSGTVVNISSVGGRMGLPLQGLYHATKHAVEGFTESIMYELQPFGIRVRLVEPGATKTDFFGRSDVRTSHPAYLDYEEHYFHNFRTMMTGKESGTAQEVARAIHKASTHRGSKLRFPVSGGAPTIMWLKRHMPERVFYSVIRKKFETPRGRYSLPIAAPAGALAAPATA